MAPNVKRQSSSGLHHMVVWRRHPTHSAVQVPVLYLRNQGEAVSKPYQPALNFAIGSSGMSGTTLKKLPMILGAIWDCLVEGAPDVESLSHEEGLRLFLIDVCRYLLYGVQAWAPGKLTAPALRWGGRSGEVVRGLGWAYDEFSRVSGSRLSEADDPFVRRCPRLFNPAVQIAYGLKGLPEISQVAHANENNASKKDDGSPDNDEAVAPILRGLIPDREKRTPYILSPTKRFPKPYLLPLLSTAYTVSEGLVDQVRRDETGEFFAKLGLGAIRGSEALNLWVNDLQVTKEGKLLGFLRHPTLYVEPSIGQTRREILAERFGLVPRTQVHGRMFAGFKSPALNADRWSYITWLAGSDGLMRQSFVHYILNVREPAMAERRAQGYPDHPYLLVFTRSIPHLGVVIGDPYTAGAARRSWSRAIRRIGIREDSAPLMVAKYLGTTRHSLRHLCGKTWQEDGVDIHDIQGIMHHKSILSTGVYTLPDDSEIHEIAEKVSNRIKNGDLSGKFREFETLEKSVQKYAEAVSRRRRFR